MMNVKYEKRDVKAWLLLLDVTITLVLLASLSLLIYHSYVAGVMLGSGEGSTAEQRDHYWAMMTSVAFLVGSLSYLFGRYFKDRFAEVNNPWL